MYDNTSSPNYLEYSITEKPNKRTRTLKAIIIGSAIAVSLTIFGVLYAIARAMMIVIPFVIVLVVFAAFIFWKYTKPEYDYVIAGGDMQMHAVYGGRSRK